MIIRVTGIGTNGGYEFANRLVDMELLTKGLNATIQYNRVTNNYEWSMDLEVQREALQELESMQTSWDTVDTILTVTVIEDHSQSPKERADRDYMAHVRVTAKQVGEDVYNDIDHQVNKYGAQRVNAFGWLATLFEEGGEAAQAYLKQNFDEAIAEAKQNIACWSRFITEVEREQQGLHESEAEWYERAK